jgi:hypothetical protein
MRSSSSDDTLPKGSTADGAATSSAMTCIADDNSLFELEKKLSSDDWFFRAPSWIGRSSRDASSELQTFDRFVELPGLCLTSSDLTNLVIIKLDWTLFINRQVPSAKSFSCFEASQRLPSGK